MSPSLPGKLPSERYQLKHLGSELSYSTAHYLMRTGVVNANLVELNTEARLPCITDLIARK